MLKLTSSHRNNSIHCLSFFVYDILLKGYFLPGDSVATLNVHNRRKINSVVSKVFHVFDCHAMQSAILNCDCQYSKKYTITSDASIAMGGEIKINEKLRC